MPTCFPRRMASRTNLLLIGAAVLAIAPMYGQQVQLLKKHVRAEVSERRAALVSALPAERQIHASIVLQLRNQDALTSLLGRLYDPSSPDYRHFLSVAQFTEQFGPSSSDFDTVVAFARANGFSVGELPANRLVVPIVGTADQVDAAFHVRMNVYQHPTENRTFFSPDREPSLNLSVPVAHIAGLDDFSLPRHMSIKPSPEGTGPLPNGQQAATVLGSGPGGSYLGSDMRAAYYGGTALTGNGQAVGLLEFGGYTLSDVNSTFSNAGQSYQVPINNVLLDGATGLATNDGEEVLDIVQAIGMAPGLSQVRVYIGMGSDDANILNSMASENIAKQLSCSWGWRPADPTVDDVFFEEMAVQGQSFFAASGDSGAYDSAVNPFFYPAEDQYVTTIGGTHLTTASAGGSWVSETVWNSGNGGSGGGISPDGIPIPSWQAGLATSANGGSATLRNVPDLAMEADFDNYNCAAGTCSGGWAGTSFATPRWAGFMALVNQQAVESSNAPAGGLGFVNPVIYQLAQGANSSADFHDITVGNNDTASQPLWFNAEVGYDLTTGWGSANGQQLIDDLAGPQVPGFWLASSLNTVGVNPGASATTNLLVTNAGGFSSGVTLALSSALPTGVTGSFSPNPTTTGSSVLTLAATSAAPGGSQIVSVTGTSGSLTATTNITVAVHAPSFALAASPASLPISQGASGVSTISVQSLYGFSGAVALSIAGLPAGVTASFSSLSTSTTSVLTLNVGSSAVGGTSALTVTGTSGSLTATTQISLTVQVPSFTLTTPATLNMGQGTFSSTYVDIVDKYGFAGNVTLSASGLPTGVTAFFASNPASATTSVTFTTSANATPGQSVVTITGTSGAVTASSTINLGVFAPSFTLSTASLLNIGVGNSASGTVSVSGLYGFNGLVNLAVSGLPTGITATVLPNPTNATATIAFTAASSASLGQSVITITGTSGSLTASTTVTLGVYNPTFTLSSSSPAIGQGGSTTTYVYVTDQYGFTGNVNLSVSGLPSGVTASFSPNPTTGTSALTFTASSSASVGQSPLTITGTSGSITATTTVTLSVNAPSFAILAYGTTIGQGASGTSNVYVSDQYGFTGAVNLAISGLPSGVTASISPNPTTGNSLITFTASSSASVGGSMVTVTGTSGSITATTTLYLGVYAPSFTLSATNVAASKGGTGTGTVTVNPVYGFTGSVNLAVSNLPTGVTASFSPNPTTGSSSVTFTASSSALLGQSVVTITGTSGSVTARASIYLSVYAPSFTLSSSAVSIGQGASTTAGIAVSYLYGFSGSVALSLSGLPTGVTALWTPNPTTTSSTLTLSAASTVTAGQYPVTVTGVSGSITATTTFTLTVYAPTFTISCYSGVNLGQGGASASTYVYSSDLYGFTGNITLSATGLPAGVTASFYPNPITTANGSSRLTLAASSAVAPGQYTITITGTSGTQTASTTLTFGVYVPTFSVPNLGNLTVGQGASTYDYIYLTTQYGFNNNVTLSLSGLPSGVTASFTPNPTTYQTELVLNASSAAAAGQYTLILTGTSGTQTSTSSFVLSIYAPTFTLSSYSSISIGQGGSGSAYVYVNPQYGFTGNVSLSASGLPSGVTASFSTNPTTSNSQLTFTASSAAAAGQYTITITGTSGSITATTSIPITISPLGFNISGPSSIAAGQGGGSTSGYFYISSTSGFSGNVTFALSGLPSGVTASFSPNPTNYSTTLTVLAAASAALGTSTITVTGTSGSVTSTTTFQLSVVAPSFTLSQYSSVTLNQGASGTSYIYINASNGFSGNVTLSASGLPNGVTASFSPNPTTYSTMLTLTASSAATPGSSTVTITGTAGSQTASTTLALTVNPSSFTLSAAPASALLTPGESQNVTLTAVPINGFSGTVSFAASGLPSGVTAVISPTATANTSTLTLTAASSATPVSGSVTVTGTSGSLTAGTSFPVAVISPAGATATTLTLTSAGSPVSTVASGMLVTATATVTAQSTPVTAGQVNLCDTTAPTCDAAHLVGSAQLTSAGTAVLQFIPSPGGHRYKAFFAGTRVNATSVSTSANLSATASLPTTTTITQTGSTGNYTLTATVTGQGRLAPSGNVSFLDTSDGNFALGGATLGNGVATLATNNPQTPTVGTQPEAIATGDFNGDGIPDLAVANTSSNSVSILLGNGDGTFQPAINMETGSYPIAVAAGDFNRDGHLDLAVVAQSGNGVDIFLGNGNGTFTPAGFSPQTGSSPIAVVVGDYNGDGLLDIAVANSGSGTITILLGNGDGTFTPTSSSPAAGSSPEALVQGDFNGDGILDLAVANSGTVSILLGVGDGTFGVTNTITGFNYAASLATGDLNGDGKLDLAVSSQYNASTVEVLLGKGDGTFTSGASPATGSNGVSVAIADFNGDGIPDLATVSYYGSYGTLFLGHGDGTFAAGVTIPTGRDPQALAVGDWNNDGVKDIAVVNYSDGTVSILTGQLAQKSTASASAISPLGQGQHAVVASYAGDGVYSASASPTTSLTAAAGPPAVTLSLSSPAISVTQPMTVTVTVSAGSANPVPTGSVQLTAGTSSATINLSTGTATIPVPAGSLPIGTDSLSVVYTPDSASSSRYTGATGTGSVVVTQATPILTWATPAPIFYGTALSGLQLNATASIPGTFVYSPAAGFVLSVGNDTLQVTFTPNDTVNYTTATASVMLVVNPLYSIWLANGNGSVSALTQTGVPITSTGLPMGGQSIAVDHSGYVWSLNQGSNSIAQFSKYGSIVAPGYTGGGLSNPISLAIDGGGTIWIANSNNTISAFTVTGTPVSSTAYGVSIPTPTSIQVDGSGNLWITNAGDNSVTEMIGVATPVVTPTATAVKNSTLAARP